MLRLLNKNNFFILLCALILISCGFIDLRPIGLSIEPDKTDSLLPDYFSPVILRFNTQMEKSETEGIMQITSVSGVVKGDRFWDGNDLYFVPAGGWTPGIRYTLNLSGSIRSTDGRDIRLERYISFFAVRNNNQPVLELYSPADGESIGTSDIFLELSFNTPMDKLSVESALITEGVSDKIFEWSDDDTLLKVFFDKALSPWSIYRWSLKDTAKSREGIPLAKTYSAHFITDIDQILPKAEKVFIVSYHDGLWHPVGFDITGGLEHGESIAIEFNKPLDENITRSVRVEPSLPGKTEMLNEKTIVYAFSANPEPETVYTLIISGETKDITGLKLGSDFRINFFSAVPELYINSIIFNSSNPVIINNFSAANISAAVPIEKETGNISFSIFFSMPISEEEKRNLPLKINLSPLFPNTLKPVALTNVRWVSDNILQLYWEGLSGSNSNVKNIYKLTVPGGKSGIKAAEGVFLSDDIVIYLETL